MLSIVNFFNSYLNGLSFEQVEQRGTSCLRFKSFYCLWNFDLDFHQNTTLS